MFFSIFNSYYLILITAIYSFFLYTFIINGLNFSNLKFINNKFIKYSTIFLLVNILIFIYINYSALTDLLIALKRVGPYIELGLDIGCTTGIIYHLARPHPIPLAKRLKDLIIGFIVGLFIFYIAPNLIIFIINNITDNPFIQLKIYLFFIFVIAIYIIINLIRILVNYKLIKLDNNPVSNLILIYLILIFMAFITLEYLSYFIIDLLEFYHPFHKR